MAEGFDTNSTQYSFLYNFTTTIASGTKVTITDSDGNVIYTATPTKEWSSIEFSSADLKSGGTYTITAGTQTAKVTLSSIATNSASTGTGMGGGMNGTGGKGGMTPPSGTNGSTGTAPDAASGATPSGGSGTRPSGGKGGMTQRE